MKLVYALLSACCFAACSTNSTAPKTAVNAKLPVHKFTASYVSVKKQATTVKNDTVGMDEQADAYADYYIVVADTGVNYYDLEKKMFSLKNTTGLPIDTLGRYYNKKKDLIALPDDDDDEIYAGNYFPRRQPASSLSLEYMNFYRAASNKKTIGLITGIYENKTSADSALKTINLPNAFDLKSKVYVGCMH